MSDPVAELKHELLAAADRLHETAARPGRGGRRWSRVLAIAAALSLTAVPALLFVASWADSPDFVARAQAALTAPSSSILHVRWTVTTTSAKPACKVTRGPSESWVDQTPPHRFRAVLRNELAMVDPPLEPDGRPLVCSKGTTTELGGTVEPRCTASGCEPTLRFVPPDLLKVMPVGFSVPVDHAAMLRVALARGWVKDLGKTTLRGRVVERLRLDPPRGCRTCPREPGYAYVDPRTFRPVELRPPPREKGVRDVIRFLAYEQLPRTRANLALADIRAQHPTAVETDYP